MSFCPARSVATAVPHPEATTAITTARTIHQLRGLTFSMTFLSFIGCRFDFVDYATLARARHERRAVPAPLDPLPEEPLVDPRQTDEPVHDRAHRRDLAEPHAEESRHQVEPRHRDETPVQGTDHHQNRCEHIESLHDHCRMTSAVEHSSK